MKVAVALLCIVACLRSSMAAIGFSPNARVRAAIGNNLCITMAGSNSNKPQWLYLQSCKDYVSAEQTVQIEEESIQGTITFMPVDQYTYQWSLVKTSRGLYAKTERGTRRESFRKRMVGHEKFVLESVNHPGYCLDIPSGRAHKGQKLIGWPCHYRSNQLFYVDHNFADSYKK